MPAFAAEYGIGALEWGRWPATDEIVMILPDLRRFIPGMKLLIVKKVDVRFPSTDARQPSSGMSSTGAGGVKLPPALVARISIGPYSSSMRFRIVSISANLVTSATTGIALLGGQLKTGNLWTAQIRQFRREAETLSSTSFPRLCANRSALSFASSVARTSARARDAAADRGVR
jgi:hypothetical protein